MDKTFLMPIIPSAMGVVSNVQAGAGNPWFLLDLRRPLKPLILQKRRGYEFKSMTKMDDENVFMRDEYRYGIDARLNVGFAFWQQAFGSKGRAEFGQFQHRPRGNERGQIRRRPTTGHYAKPSGLRPQ